MSDGIIQLSALCAMLPGAQLFGAGGTAVSAVSTDARTVGSGELFIGLKGARFDGTDFAAQAAQRGAAAVMVSRHLPDVPVPQIVVDDVARAFCESAAAWRQQFRIPVISVSGSNGKTTTTQMIASILRAAYGENGYLATRGNFNNSVGVPITLWRLRAEHRAAVVESGMNHPGEMKALSAMIRPTVALVNNAQREHQEFLCGVEATARENACSIEALPQDGTAVFPADDACTAACRAACGARRALTFSTHPGISADVTAEVFSLPSTTEVRMHTPWGDAMVRIALGGRHNGHNAVAAATCALAAGVPLDAVVSGLQEFCAVARRGVRHSLQGGSLLIDDTYNANPDSMRAGIEVLAGSKAPRVLIAGDMGEVGSRGPEFHAEIGAYARQKGVEHFLACGPMMRNACDAYGDGARHFEDASQLSQAAVSLLGAVSGATVLVKASNYMHFDAVVNDIVSACGGKQV